MSKGTVGRYVTDNAEVIELCRKKVAKQTVEAFAKSIQPLALPKEEIIKLLKEELG